MHLLHGGDGGEENVPGLLPGHGALLLQDGQQRSSFHVIHDDVGGVVLQKALPYPDDFRNTIDLCHLPGLPEEGLHAGDPELFGLLSVPPLQGGAHSGKAADLTAGEVFLDGNFQTQIQIKTNIGDAKAALAQHLAHHIVAIEKIAVGQDIIGSGRFSRVKAAVGTGVALNFFHAAKAAVKLHTNFLFSPCFLHHSTGNANSQREYVG